MPTPFDNAALTGPGSCGCHQQVFSGLVSDPGGLPEGAIAYANFKDGTYFYGGNELDDFLVTDENFGPFDPMTSIEAGTGLVADAGPIVASALTTELLASGFTAVVVWQNDGTDTRIYFEATDLPGYNVEHQVLIDNTGSTLLKQAWPSGPELVMDYDVIADAQNKAAMSFKAEELALSVNGNPVGTLAVDPGSPHTSIGIRIELIVPGSTAAIEEIVFWPLQLNAALPGMSAL